VVNQGKSPIRLCSRKDTVRAVTSLDATTMETLFERISSVVVDTVDELKRPSRIIAAASENMHNTSQKTPIEV
jgi:hypothetical protein